MLNIHLKKFVALLVIVLIIGMSSISITGKTTKKEIQTTGSSIDEGVDWWTMLHHDLNHTGYTTSTGPETNNVLWVYESQSRIRSSPAIVDNRIFFGDVGDTFYCLDSNTGEEIWKTDIFSYARSSPAVVDGRIYFSAYTGSGIVGAYIAGAYCLNATTGAVIWKYDIGEWSDIYFSPAVTDGKVYISFHEPGLMCCLNATTGEEIWVTEIRSPRSPAVCNGKVYFGALDRNVYCLNGTNGEEIWKYSTNEAIPGTPTLYDGKLYIGADGLLCLNMSNGEFIWKLPGKGSSSAPCISNGKIYVNPGYLYCLDADTGQEIWSNSSVGYGNSPILSESRIYIAPNSGWVYCFNASSGDKIWDFQTGSRIFSNAAVADGKFYVGSWEDGEMLCFGGESDNNPPHTPAEILGPTSVKVNVEYTYNTSTFDPDGDQLYYKWYGDEVESSEWIGPFDSNETVEFKITFFYEYIHTIRVIVKDINHARSDYVTLEISVTPKNRIISNSLFIGLLERFPLLERFLLLLIN